MRQLFKGGALCIALAIALQLPAFGSRVFTPTDLLQLYELPVPEIAELYGGYAVSPDGSQIAYVLQRPRASAGFYTMDLLDNERADVWLVSTKTGLTHVITPGAHDGAGYFRPIWSPDGSRLAILSTRGGHMGLWIWEKASGRLHQLTTYSCNPTASTFDPPQWLSNRVIIGMFLANGKPPVSEVVQAERQAIAGWQRTNEGKPSVSVIDTGISTPQQPPSLLLAVDTESGKTMVLGRGDIRNFRISPDGRKIAFIANSATFLPEDRQPLPLLMSDDRLVIVDRNGRVILPRTTRITNIEFDFEHYYTAMAWSPDSQILAVRGMPDIREKSFHLYEVYVDTKQIADVTDPAIGEPENMVWSKRGQLVFSSQASTQGSSIHAQSNSGWWAVTGASHMENLTAGLKNPPDFLYARSDGSFIGAADGSIWRFDVGHNPVAIVRSTQAASFERILPPSPIDLQRAIAVVQMMRGRERAYAFLNTRTGKARVIQAPAAAAQLAAYSSADSSAMYIAQSGSGLFAWLVRPRPAKAALFVRRNLFLAHVIQSRRYRISFRSQDGKELSAWLMLPANYMKGRRYPLVEWVYPGQVAGSAAPQEFDMSSAFSLFNLNLLAAHGYAVLYPTIPVRPQPYVTGPDPVGNPLLDLTKSVIPAADAVVKLGIADPKRLGVMGHSGGGWAVYGIVTQTHHFAAAIALAGLSNLVSAYGTYDPRSFYSAYIYPNAVPSVQFSEQWIWRFGVPPWLDIDRYLKNSALTYVENVTTPIMIVQGDLDYVPVQQGEEFATAMWRLGKRARFVRYWGESHIIESPGNILDAWKRMYEWFDQYLCKGSISKTSCNLP